MSWSETKFCQLEDKRVVIRGRAKKKSKLKRLFHAKGPTPTVHVYSQQTQGEMLDIWPAPCCKWSEDGSSTLLELVIDSQQYVAASCHGCNTITLHDFPSGTVQSRFNIENEYPGKMCHGPDNTLLVFALDAVIQLSCSASNLEKIKCIPVEKFSIHIALNDDINLCYSDQKIFLSSMGSDHMITSMDIISEETLWTVGGEVDGSVLHPVAMCTDKRDRLYVGDFVEQRIIVLHTKTGDFIQIIKLPELGYTRYLSWNDAQPHLTICGENFGSDYTHVCYCNIETLTAESESTLYPDLSGLKVK